MAKEEKIDLTEAEIKTLKNLIQKDKLSQEEWENLSTLLQKRRLYIAITSIEEQESNEEFFESIIKDEDGNIPAFTTEELCHEYLDEHPPTALNVWAGSLPFRSMGFLANTNKVRVLIDRDNDRFLGYDGETRMFWIYVACD
ncbi:MAG: hypothetical protein IIY58_05695 [Aeriscardovia sp.]|nr:hypothetical protein [Aeriscardovia sp.]